MLYIPPGEIVQQQKILSPEAADALTKAVEAKRRYIPEIVFKEKTTPYTPSEAALIAKAVTQAAKEAAETAIAKTGTPVTVITETGQPVIATSPLVGTVNLLGREIPKTVLFGLGAVALLYFATRK